MQADKPFPKEYLNDPKRRAEHRVYRQLAESDLPGLFIFEWKRDKKSAEVDFVVWIRGVGLFAIQVKGGSYQYRRDDDREWYLRKSRRVGDSTFSAAADVVWRRRAHPLVAQDTRFPEFRAAGLALHGHGPGP